MKKQNLPRWARDFLHLRAEATHIPERAGGAWTENEKNVFSKIVYIAYPNGVYYAVDKLESGEWVQQDDHHYVPETAYSSAQKRAYLQDTPYRVREVVWTG